MSNIVFQQSLDPVRRRASRVGWAVAAAAALLVGLAWLVAGMWWDLAFPLSVAARRVMVPAAGLLAGLAWVTVWFRGRRRRTDSELVRSVDAAARSTGQVMAGYDLAKQNVADAAASPELTRRLAALAGQQADAECQQAEPARVVPAATAKKWWKLVAMASVLLVVAGVVMPKLAWTQTLRILFPSANQLPYSPSTITVSPGDVEVLFGEDLPINASVAGPALESLEIVLVSDDGAEDVFPMLEESDGKWQSYLTRITHPTTYFARARGSKVRSAAHRIEVKLTPQFRTLSCRITPPAYTRKGVYDGPIPDRGIEGLAGTEVEFTIVSNRPLAGGQIVVSDKEDSTQTFTLAPVDASEGELQTNQDGDSMVVRGGFTLTSEGNFSIGITDVEGTDSSTRIEGSIRLLRDTAPVVGLLEPKPVSLATPDVILPIVVAAEDDYGLSSLQLFRGLNQSPSMPTNLDIPTDQAAVRQATHLPLAAYGLQPGDEITLFARAEDNDPSSAKGAESPVAIVRIISKEQLAQLELDRRGVEAIVSKQRQMQRALDALRQELEAAGEAAQEAAQATADDPKARSGLSESLEKASQAAEQAAQTAQKLAENPLPVDVDREMSQRLSEMAKEMQEAAERIKSLQQKSQSEQPLSEDDQQALKDLLEQLDQSRDQHNQQMMKPSEDFAKILPLAADEQRFAQLVRRQRELATRIDSLSTQDLSQADGARRGEQLRREQQQLQVALGDLLDDIESHVNALPDDPELKTLADTATEFVRAVRQSQADPAMSQAQIDLLDDDARAAGDQSLRAAEILESFLSQCKGMGNSACQNCKAKFNPSAGCPNPGNSVDQLLARMGLGSQPGSRPGMGPGSQPGGGYSMRQQTAENVGIYGGIPSQAAPPRRGSSQSQAGGVATYTTGGSARPGRGASGKTETTGARGDVNRIVPSQYRSNVSDYFRRIAEDLGDQSQ